MFGFSRPELRVWPNSDSEMQRFESCRPSHAVVLSQVRSPAIVMHPLVYRPNTMPAWPEQTGLLFYPQMLYFAQRRSGLTPVLRAERGGTLSVAPSDGNRLRAPPLSYGV